MRRYYVDFGDRYGIPRVHLDRNAKVAYVVNGGHYFIQAMGACMGFPCPLSVRSTGPATIRTRIMSTTF